MDLQELFTTYKIPQEGQDFVNGLIQAEKDKAITETGKKGKELKAMVTERNKLRDLIRGNFNIDPESEDLESNLSELKEKLQKAGNEAIEKLNKSWEKKFSDLTKTLEAKDAEKLALETKLDNSKITDILGKAMGDKFNGKSLAIRDLIRDKKVKLTEDKNDVVFVNGDEELELAKGLDKFAKDNQDLVRNIQNPGSGGGSKIITNSKGEKTMTYEDWLAMPPKERATFQLDPKNTVLPRKD
jgi:hypothetical protein